MDTNRRIDDLATAQRGLIAVRQLLDLGLPDSTVRDLARRRGWDPVARGVFRLPGAPSGFLADVQRGLLVVGPPAAASHMTAAALWGLAPPESGPVHLLLPHDRAYPAGRGLRGHRTERWDRCDRTVVDGLACTTVERTLISVAAIGADATRPLVIDAVQRRLTTPRRLATRAADLVGVPGSRRIGRLARQLAEDPVDSEAERRCRLVLRRAGHAPHPGPYPIRVGDGRVLHVDVALVEDRIAIEVDGFAYHSTREQLATDHARLNALQLAGWVVIRVGWDRLHRDVDGFLDEVAAAVALRATSAPPHPRA